MQCTLCKANYVCQHPEEDRANCLGCQEYFYYRKYMDYLWPEAKEFFGIDALREELQRRECNKEDSHE